jgi:signal transduction histidine kinase
LNLQALPYVAPLVVTAVLSVAMIAVAMPQRVLPGVRWFLVFMAGLVVWTLAYAAEILVPGLPAKLLTAKVQYLGIPFVPMAWLAFAAEYSGLSRGSARTVFALALFPVVTVVVAWTNELHGLLYSAVGVTAGPNYQVLDLTYGIWFWLTIVFSYACLLVATGLLVRVILIRPPLFRKQATLLLVAGLAPWLGNILYVTGLNPTELDLTVFGFAISGFIAGWAILRWRLLSIGPIGRDTIVEGLSEAVAVIDKEGRIVDVNPSAVAVLGKNADALVGHDANDALGAFAPELDPDRGNRHPVVGLEGERRYDVQVDPLRDARGRLRGWTMVLFDVTERAAEAEALEKARAVAEGTARAQRLFLTNMNHELRTPLNGVLGMLEVLLASDMNPDHRKYAELAQASGNDLLGLVDRILDFTKLETGQVDLVDARFDFSAAVQEAVDACRPQAAEKSLKVVLAADPDVPVWVRGDPERVHQILSALVNNAVQFTDEGEIRIGVSLESRSDGVAHVRVGVSDTGLGLPADRLEAIFEPLTQVDASHTRRHDGAGLGLTIARRLVEGMGGELEVESVLGEGSSFFFTLPLRLP